jgi:glyoxylase-like metal-dependent hydrolase (beta-lactamase superfamily II)
MQLSRRDFSVLAGASMGALLLGAPASGRRPEPEAWLEWKKVADRAWAGIGEGGNSLAVRDADEWVLIDTKNPGFGEALIREGGVQAGGARLARVINTHHHADHTGGNYAFTPKVPVVAHAAALPRVKGQIDRYKERLQALPAQVLKSQKPGAAQIVEDTRELIERIDDLDAARFVPTETFEKESEQKVGATRLVLHHFGPGHTDNDAVVHIPDLDVVHTGDLVFNGRHPFMDAASGATSTGWIASLQRVIELCRPETIVVPGHGDITTIEGVRTQIRYFEAARAAVRKAVDAGATREKASESEIVGFDALGSQGKSRVLSAIYDELAAPGQK